MSEIVDYSKIIDFYDKLAKDNSKIVTVETIGQSVGRSE